MSSNGRRPGTIGTRVSSRLRGREEEDIWQPIPEEWLKTNDDAEDEGHLAGRGDENEIEAKKETAMRSLDDVSELTSLSDLSELSEADEEKTDEEETSDSTPTPPPDFSLSSEETWETVGSAGIFIVLC